MAPPLAQMRAQMDAVIDDWAVPCAITRYAAGTRDAAGHQSAGAYGNLATAEKLWIQSIGGNLDIGAQGLDASTTHLAYQKYSGVSLMPTDKIKPSGSTYDFDVVRAHLLETHRVAEVRQVERT